MQAHIAQKMSVLRVLETKGADEAIRKYPEFDLFIRGISGVTKEQLQLIRQSLIVEMQKFKDA